MWQEYLKYQEECQKAGKEILAYWEWCLIRDIIRKS